MPKHSHRALVVPLQPILLTRQLAQVNTAEVKLHRLQQDVHNGHDPRKLDWWDCSHVMCVYARWTLTVGRG